MWHGMLLLHKLSRFSLQVFDRINISGKAPSGPSSPPAGQVYPSPHLRASFNSPSFAYVIVFIIQHFCAPPTRFFSVTVWYYGPVVCYSSNWICLISLWFWYSELGPPTFTFMMDVFDVYILCCFFYSSNWICLISLWFWYSELGPPTFTFMTFILFVAFCQHPYVRLLY
jgi:hypothetical protein